MITLYILVGIFAFRGRGGMFNEIVNKLTGLKLNTQEGRGIYALIMMSLYIGSVPIWALPLLLIGYFAGSVFPWFTDTDRDARTRNGFVAMSARGVVFTVLPSIVLIACGHPYGAVPIVAGLLLGVCCNVASRIPSKVHDFEQGPALGEALFGAVNGAAAYFG